MTKTNIPDKINCTYWWRINLNNTHPRNQGNNNFLIGYSKFQNQAEALDKTQCLCSKIEMFAKHGYIERCTSIEIYKKLNPMPSEQDDQLILILYPSEYKIAPNLVGKTSNDFNTFINKYYECINEKKPVVNLRPIPAIDYSKDNLFKIDKHNFKNVLHLYNWCNKQVANGHPVEMVQNFARKYMDKYFLNFGQ